MEKITFTTQVQAALFTQELVGQISDGMWENSGPTDHWQFWCDLEVVVGPEAKVETDRPGNCKKTNYSFSRLIKYVGDRMLKIGRMALCSADPKMWEAATYMPDTAEEWKQGKAFGGFRYDYITKHVASVSDELAERFYATQYTEKDLRKDLKEISRAMKNLQIV